MMLINEHGIQIDIRRVHDEEVEQEVTHVRFPCHVVLVGRVLGIGAVVRCDTQIEVEEEGSVGNGGEL